MAKRIAVGIIATTWAAFLGFIAAWVMWMWIYGIGSSVIADQEHYDHADAVHAAGVFAGLLCGIACVVVSRRPFLLAFLVYLLAGLTFVVLPIPSWQAGVRNFFTSLAFWTVAVVLWKPVRRLMRFAPRD